MTNALADLKDMLEHVDLGRSPRSRAAWTSRSC
jgi:hypothetical protein